ncbi:MAG: 2-hydroxyacid dehydrogenase [Clostridia bacterium]|nr:2-hydroxyacid dehydrogenase [Clostridia bacterium]MBO7215665.1 2-hydroxyacid dehydrogenase [Clostridia bacterium]MBO7737887.1 2-hydroxyacid dehydrogenase [Clostridia bacterium]
MKIAFFDTKPYDKQFFDIYGEKHGVEFKYYEAKLNCDTVGLAKGYDGVCAFVNDTVDASVIDSLEAMGIKILALRCAGYNNVDMKHAFGRIHVLRVPAYSPYAVAEHTMALLLTSIRRIHKAYIRTKDFNFSLSGFTGFDLHGKTVGIIGTGKIGRVFTDICKGFGMKVLAYDKYPAEGYEDGEKVKYVDTDTIFRESDVISLHCPLTEETRHIINKDTIEKCKKGVVILNTSRGGLVDAEALLNGIKERKVGAACLDVYEEEADLFFEDYSGHIVEDDTLARLISMPNVIVTSHQAFLTQEALSNIAETTVRNIVEMSKNGMCQNELCYRCGNTVDCKDGKCF